MEEDTLARVAKLGLEMESLLSSEAFDTGLVLARARIFEGWARAVTPQERENLHAEMRALERILDAFRHIDEEGAVAREAIRRSRDE